MQEEEAEIAKRSEIVVAEVLQSIQKEEGWREQLFARINQGEQVENFINEAIIIWKKFEEAAQNPTLQLPKTVIDAAKIKALWIISAPGTYFQVNKSDRFQDKPWSCWMDRHRDNRAFEIGRHITEILSGQKLDNNWANEKKLIDKYGPWIIYNGRSDESLAFAEALRVPWFKIPKGLEYSAEKTFVVHPIEGFNPDTNTLDNINTFRLPAGLILKKEDEIGVVIHAPQAVRFLYILGNCKKDIIPPGVNLRIFPLPTPKGGFPEYPLQEIRGLVNFRFIANPPKAADAPYHFISEM